MRAATQHPTEVEHRFLVSRAAAKTFLYEAASHLRVCLHDALRPVSWVRSTYFDTHDEVFFRSCGTPHARRLRLREYAAATDLSSKAVLTGQRWIELKEIRGRERSKLRAPARAGETPWGGIPELEAVLPIAPLFPTVSTWYRRLALQDQGVRVTLDEALAWCLPPSDDGAAGTLAEPSLVIACGPSRVLEVKTVGAMPAWLTAAMNALPSPSAGFSKFHAASLALRHDGSVRARRLTAPLDIPIDITRAKLAST